MADIEDCGSQISKEKKEAYCIKTIWTWNMVKKFNSSF